MFDRLTESEWNLKLLKVKWDGTKWLSQTFILAFYPNEFKFISTQNPRVKMTWLLPFEIKRVFEKIWILFGNISNYKTLCSSMIFLREDKMTSSIICNTSWKLQRIKLEVIWKYFETPFQFGIIWILFKLFSPKNK